MNTATSNQKFIIDVAIARYSNVEYFTGSNGDNVLMTLATKEACDALITAMYSIGIKIDRLNEQQFIASLI